MSKKRILTVLLLFSFLILILGVGLSFNNSSSLSDDSIVTPPSGQEGGTTPEGPLLVIPESPLGVLGLIGAFTAALAVYSQRKKK